MAKGFFRVIALLTGLCPMACGSGDESSEGGQTRACAPGASFSCACTDGSYGVQTCDASGALSACDRCGYAEPIAPPAPMNDPGMTAEPGADDPEALEPTTLDPASPAPEGPVANVDCAALPGDPNPNSSYEPWPCYWEEFPAKYHYMVYDPAVHPGAVGTTADQAAAGGVSYPGDPMEHDCSITPPTEQQIRAANDTAVRTAMFLETLPVFADKAEADAYRAQYGMGEAFTIPGLDFLWDTAGWHYIYSPGIGDGQEVVPDRPEIVDYIQTTEGFRPIGVMLMAEGGGTGDDFGGCLTFWHIHDAFGPIGAALGYMLHIYVYGNPNGPYNEPMGCTAANYPDCVNQIENPLENPIHGQ